MFQKVNRPLIGACLLMGVGLGGFFDGILFHQILQLHSMLSNQLPKTTIPNMEVNMFWDGLFHAVTWIATVAGLGLLWRAIRRPEAVLSTKIFVGSLLAGWGLFNFVEGIIDHHILHVHHVVDGPVHLGWDLTFLASGLALLGVGYSLIKKGETGVDRVVLRQSRAA
jgi:uncharacterized membrane protein